MNNNSIITERHYQIAKLNGIPKRYVYDRVNRYGWSIERAISQPCKRNSVINISYGSLAIIINELLMNNIEFSNVSNIDDFISKLADKKDNIIELKR